MKAWNRLVVALTVCAIGGAGALGCNTFRGAGRDIQKGGQAVENAADNAQSEINTRSNRQPTIMASADTGGWITPSGSTGVPYGSNPTFTIEAHSGYHVADVLVDGNSLGAVSRHTFDNVTVNHTIAALFTPDPAR